MWQLPVAAAESAKPYMPTEMRIMQAGAAIRETAEGGSLARTMHESLWNACQMKSILMVAWAPNE